MDGSVISEAAALLASSFGEALPGVLGFVFGGYAVILIVRVIRGAVR